MHGRMNVLSSAQDVNLDMWFLKPFLKQRHKLFMAFGPKSSEHRFCYLPPWEVKKLFPSESNVGVRKRSGASLPSSPARAASVKQMHGSASATLLLEYRETWARCSPGLRSRRAVTPRASGDAQSGNRPTSPFLSPVQTMLGEVGLVLSFVH